MLNIDDFVNAMIQSLKDDGVDFDGTETESREKMSLMATDMFTHSTIHTTSVGVDTVISARNELVVADTSIGAVLITLPSAAAAEGKLLKIKRVGALGVTVGSTDLIDGAATQAIAVTYGLLAVVSDGTTYHIVSSI